MSIINDALKKVQQNFDLRKKIVASTPPAAGLPAKGRGFHLSRIIILGSFLASLVILTFVFTSKQKNTSARDPRAASAVQASAPLLAKTTTVPESPRISPEQKNKISKNRVAGLTLSGIVRMDDGYIALINNEIVSQGDAIGDKKVLSISEDEVEIFYNGETVTLRLGQF